MSNSLKFSVLNLYLPLRGKVFKINLKSLIPFLEMLFLPILFLQLGKEYFYNIEWEEFVLLMVCKFSLWSLQAIICTFSFEIKESSLSDTRCCITTLVIKEWCDVAQDLLCQTTLSWRHIIGMQGKTHQCKQRKQSNCLMFIFSFPRT